MDGDLGLNGAIGFKCPDVVFLSPKYFNSLAFAVDEDVFFEAGQSLVIVKFVASIEGFGSAGENFDDQFGETLVGAGFAVVGVAGNE